ncbi:hypothetical protein [Pontibacter korlensis]|nr:hypothetical protein [Pontibacter korlensis]
MLKTSSYYANMFLNSFGLELNRSTLSNVLFDLSGTSIDPVEALYRSKGRPFVMDIPISKCFSIDFSGSNPNNPFVQTLIAYDQGNCTSYKGSPLEDYYNKWQPANAVALDKHGRELAPPWDYGPKKSSNLPEARLNRKGFLKVKKELHITEKNLFGHISRGPVSEGFGEITFNRLVQIYNSIKRNGYRPDEMSAGHIQASFFVDGRDYRVSVSSGKHRVTALQALGYEKVPIQFGPPKFPVMIRRDEVDSWPNVRLGHYTKEEALRLFDKKFQDIHPSNWQWEQN